MPKGRSRLPRATRTKLIQKLQKARNDRVVSQFDRRPDRAHSRLAMMSSETYVTGLVCWHPRVEQERIEVGSRVRQFAALRPDLGHIEALVEVRKDDYLKVTCAREYPLTAPDRDITERLEKYLN